MRWFRQEHRAVAFACAAVLSLAGCASSREAVHVTGQGTQAPAARAPVVIALQPYRKTVAVRAKVGSHEGTFLLDTGGGLTLVTPAFAKKMGCEPWGRVTGFQMMGQRMDTQRCDDVTFELPGLKLHAPMVDVFDILSLYPPGAEPVDGSIALDVFAGQSLTLDLAHQRLIVETPESLAERTRTMTEGQLRIGRELQGAALAVSAAARTPKGLVWFELDTGNGGTWLLSRHFAPEFGLDPDVKGTQPARFSLVGDVPVEGDFFVPDMIIDGNLGMQFLSRYVVTLDLARSRVWFQPNIPPASASAH